MAEKLHGNGLHRCGARFGWKWVVRVRAERNGGTRTRLNTTQYWFIIGSTRRRNNQNQRGKMTNRHLSNNRGGKTILRKSTRTVCIELREGSLVQTSSVGGRGTKPGTREGVDIRGSQRNQKNRHVTRQRCLGAKKNMNRSRNGPRPRISAGNIFRANGIQVRVTRELGETEKTARRNCFCEINTKIETKTRRRQRKSSTLSRQRKGTYVSRQVVHGKLEEAEKRAPV